MNPIPLSGAKARLTATAPGLYADFLPLIENSAPAFESGSAVVIKTAGYACDPHETVWYICDTGGADLAAAAVEIEQNFGKEHDISAFFMGQFQRDCCLLFSRIGEPYDDPAVRPLTARDGALLAPLAEEDSTPFARAISDNLLRDFEALKAGKGIRLSALFDGETPAGFVSFQKSPGAPAAVNNVLVLKNHRKKGYAARLIRAALSAYPGERYAYSCGSDNPASVASARAAGFIFEGSLTFGLDALK